MATRPKLDDYDEFTYNPDDYVIGKKLGAGAFGETFIAKDKRSGNRFVVKRLPKAKKVETVIKEKLPDGRIVEKKVTKITGTTKEMFDEEADILRHAKHVCGPGILCYVGVGAKNNDPTSPDRILVTEFLDNYITLEDYIKNTAEEERWAGIRPLFTNLLLGLEDLHRVGIAHRDIKPSNLMVNPAGEEPAAAAHDQGMHIKYIDVGLSCLKKNCKDLVGTPLYLMDEISFERDKPLLPLNFETYKKADYWALAVTLIEYILGEEEFDQYLNENIRPKNMIDFLPSEFVNEYPDIYAALEHMLADVPGTRRLPKIRFD